MEMMRNPSRGPRRNAFRERLRRGEPMAGTFVKTPHASIIEVLCRTSLDVVCLDAEHAPFDRATLDQALLAARAEDLPAVVRIQSYDPTLILNALDLGADGVVLPHVTTAADANRIARAARYGPGGRGYSGSTRAAGYTTCAMAEVLAEAEAHVVVIAQIEDAAALDEIDAISAVEGIDCLFIGRSDLTVSLGATSPSDPRVLSAVEKICESARRHSRKLGMFLSDAEEIPRWQSLGVSLFLIGSDQQWMLQGAREVLANICAKSSRKSK